MVKIWSVSESRIALVTHPHSTKTPKHISYCGIITRPYPLSTFKIILFLFSNSKWPHYRFIRPCLTYIVWVIHTSGKHNHSTKILEAIEIYVQIVYPNTFMILNMCQKWALNPCIVLKGHCIDNFVVFHFIFSTS